MRRSVGGAQVLPSGPSTEDICQLLGDLTGVQVGLRDLGQNEERAVLAKRCRKGVAKRNLLALSRKVDMWLSTIEAASK